MSNFRYSVLVGNVGTVHETNNLRDARLCARTYVDRSKSNCGRCAGEPVYVLDAGEVLDSYEPGEQPLAPRHPDYSDFAADDFDTAILDVFGDYARRDLDGESYAALYADVRLLAQELAEDEDADDLSCAAQAAVTLRQRIGGVEQLPGYVASLVAGARYRARLTANV